MDHLGGSFDLDQTLSQFQTVQTGLALALTSGAGWSSVALLTCLVMGWLSAQAVVGGEDGTGSHGCHSPVSRPGLFTAQSQEVTIVNGNPVDTIIHIIELKTKLARLMHIFHSVAVCSYC